MLRGRSRGQNFGIKAKRHCKPYSPSVLPSKSRSGVDNFCSLARVIAHWIVSLTSTGAAKTLLSTTLLSSDRF